MDSQPPSADWTGRAIGRYEVREHRGAGGTGDVYRAFDVGLRRDVALKRLRPGNEDLRERARRLLHEGRAGATLRHPAIVATYDILEHEGEAVLVTEWVDGPTLRAHLGQAWPLERFYPFAEECLAALATAHAQRIVHCDVKPENILVDREGRPHFLDFGFAYRWAPEPSCPSGETANAAERAADPTESEGEPRLGGTPAYMAPERILGDAPAPPADLFALGLVFYEMLTGRHPFFRPTIPETRDAILRAQPPAIRSIIPAVPASLARIVHALLDRDPRARPAAASLRDLRSLVYGETPWRGSSPRAAAPGARDFYLQGLRYLERPRTEANLLDAERLFERSLREDPDLAVAWAGLAETWWARHMETHEDRWKDKAEEAALRAHTIDPSSAAVLTAMGTTQRHTGRTELAEASFREALEQDPSWVPARIGHALSLESAGRYEEAEAELERCVRQRSDWAETHAVLGRFCLRRGRMAEAIAHIFDAVDRAPDDSRSYSDLGAALQYEGRIGEAIEAYRTAQAIRPNYAALCNLASLYRDTDRPEEAVEVLEEALRLQDHDFLVWKALALTLLVLGRDPERTRHAFLRSIELAEAAAAENPRDAVVLAQLAELYLEVGDRTAARLRIQRALSLGGGWVDVEVSAASVCWETGDREGCLAHMEAALKLGFRASALRRDRAFRECVQSEEVAALLRRYEPSVESDREREKEDVMGTEPFGKGGKQGPPEAKRPPGSGPAPPPTPPPAPPTPPPPPQYNKTAKENVILVYDQDGVLQIASEDCYAVHPGEIIQWRTGVDAFQLIIEAETRDEVLEKDGSLAHPALSTHKLDHAIRTFHIKDPQDEHVATATLIVSQDKF